MITPYPHTFSGEQAVQEKEEFEAFLAFVREKNIKSYLEIGVARGDTFHEVISQMQKGSKAVAVDYPEKSWGINDSREYLMRVIEDLLENGYDSTLIFGDSKSDRVIFQTSSVLSCEKIGISHIDGFPYSIKEKFDLIFIDGDHTYEGVKADFDNYSPMGRYIAFHDIANDMKRNSKGELIEVPIFWNELKQKYKHWEFIVEGSNMGIGVIECSPAT